MPSEFQSRSLREDGAPGESPRRNFPSTPLQLWTQQHEGERNREESPGGGERPEVSSDSRGKNQVVLSYREKPSSGMGRLG